MGTSFVTLESKAAGEASGPDGGTGFWVNDSLLALVLRLLTLHIPEPAPGPEGEVVKAIRERWLLASGESFPGCVPHGLEEIAKNQYGLAVAKSAVASLIGTLERTPRLHGSIFPLLGLGAPAGRDIEPAELKDILQQLANLLDERDSDGRSPRRTPIRA